MPKATQPTTTRRRLCGGSAALLAIAPMLIAAAATPHPDRDLLRLCAEFEATELRIIGIYDGPDRTINDAEADRLAAPLEAHRDVLLADMGTLTAKTADGIAARAQLLASHNYSGAFAFDDPDTLSGTLLAQLLRDARKMPAQGGAV
jgi:hypothetical protein